MVADAAAAESEDLAEDTGEDGEDGDDSDDIMLLLSSISFNPRAFDHAAILSFSFSDVRDLSARLTFSNSLLFLAAFSFSMRSFSCTLSNFTCSLNSISSCASRTFLSWAP